MGRLVLCLMIFSLAAGFFSAAVEAHTDAPNPPARITYTDGRDVLNIAIDPEWVQWSEGIAAKYAAEQGYGLDHCPVSQYEVWSNTEIYNGIGLAWLDECKMSVDLDMTETRASFCRIYVHERLHLWRGDGWHAPGGTDHPLAEWNSNHAMCHYDPTEGFRLRTAKRMVRKRCPRPKWRIRMEEAWEVDGLFQEVLLTCDQRRRPWIRSFYVTKDDGKMIIERDDL